MQDRQITPSDDAQRRIPLSALYQNQPPYGASPQALPSASSDVFHPNLEKLYIFRNANDVTSFLEENPFLIPLLQDAYTHIKEYFPDSDVFLKVAHDPEFIGQKQLVAFIAVKQTAEEASQALDRFDEGWGLEAWERAEDKLCITLEFL
jgi:hypothetical protein